MNSLLKTLSVLLLCAIVLGLVGCAESENTSSDTSLPSETPSKEDMSHGWGPSPEQ